MKCGNEKKIWGSYLTAIVLIYWDVKRKWSSYLTSKVLKDWYENNETLSYLTAIMMKSVKEMVFLLDSNRVDGSSDDHQHRDEYLEWVDCVTTPTHLHKGSSFKLCIIRHFGLSLIIIKKKIGWIHDHNFFFALWWSVWDYCCHDHYNYCIIVCRVIIILHYCIFFTKQMSALATRTSSLLYLTQGSSLWNLFVLYGIPQIWKPHFVSSTK